MKKIVLGVTSLLAGSEMASANMMQKFIDITEPKIIEKPNSTDKLIKITKQNLVKSREFFNELGKLNIFEDFNEYKLTNSYIVENEQTSIVYVLENEFKIINIKFPILYNNGFIEKIYPMYFDSTKKEIISYELTTELKNIKSEIFDKIFPKSERLLLNKTDKTDKIDVIIFESENKASYEHIINMFDTKGKIKEKYADKNIEIIPISTNYYSEKYSIELSGLLKSIADKQKGAHIFINYLLNRKNMIDSIESKYFKKFRDGYADDFILDMYKESNDAMNTILKDTLTLLLEQIQSETNKDILSIMKREQKFTEFVIKQNILETDYISFQYYTNSKFYYKK